MPSDLIEKEKGYQNAENTYANESSSDIEEEGEEEQEEEVAYSENDSEAEDTQESDNDTEKTVRKEKVVILKRPPPFTLKVPVNIVRTLMCTGH